MNKRLLSAQSYIWAYQLILDDGTKGTANVFIDFHDLDLPDNTLKITLKEGKVTGTCTRVEDVSELETITSTSRPQEKNQIVTKFNMPNTELDMFAKLNTIERTSRKRLFIDFKLNDADGVEKEFGCCLVKKSRQWSFLYYFNTYFGPKGLRTPIDTVNDLVDP